MKNRLFKTMVLAFAVVLTVIAVFTGCGDEKSDSLSTQPSSSGTAAASDTAGSESSTTLPTEKSTADPSAPQETVDTDAATSENKQSSAPQTQKAETTKAATPTETTSESTVKLPSEAELAELIDEVGKYHYLFDREIPNAEAMDFWRLFEMYIVLHDIHIPWERDNTDGWVFAGEIEGYFGVADLFKKHIPHDEIDSWTKLYFGRVYDYSDLHVNLFMGGEGFDISYDPKENVIVFDGHHEGVGGGLEEWSDYIRYAKTYEKIDDYTYGFTYYLHTSTKPKGGKSGGDYVIYEYCDEWDWWEYRVEPIEDWQTYDYYSEERITPIWKVPYRLTFRYDGESFKFVSFGKV